MSSRYYDPEIGRFINADDASYLGANGDFASLNLFAYCGNNPVTRADSNGKWWHLVVGAAVGVATQLVFDLAYRITTGESAGSTIVDYAAAALSGAVAASGIGLVGSIVVNGAINEFAYAASCEMSGTTADPLNRAVAFATGGLAGAIGGAGVNGKKLMSVIETATDALETAVSPKKIAQYTSMITKSVNTIVEGVVNTFKAGIFGNIANKFRSNALQ